MKQKLHSTEPIIRILRHADGTTLSILFAASTTSPKRPSIGGAENMATWIWLMPNDSKPWKKKMLAGSMLKNPILEEVNAKNW